VKKSEEEHFWDGGSAPKLPRFSAFAPGFLDREASCARHLGIPAAESALEFHPWRPLPSGPLSLSGMKSQKNYGRLHKKLDAPEIVRALVQRIEIGPTKVALVVRLPTGTSARAMEPIMVTLSRV
jgi:hypothetical protein